MRLRRTIPPEVPVVFVVYVFSTHRSHIIDNANAGSVLTPQYLPPSFGTLLTVPIPNLPVSVAEKALERPPSGGNERLPEKRLELRQEHVGDGTLQVVCSAEGVFPKPNMSLHVGNSAFDLLHFSNNVEFYCGSFVSEPDGSGAAVDNAISWKMEKNGGHFVSKISDSGS
ncbi:hypothetical protein GEV33_002039 [Tenebrio molitor]|uniref:Uncharacterized protein n=1 Tax=Tenebrio molitor TaxID=7067 RepID=A0A8J6HUY0_TENMO|nr:hypothetical protein GEV33_002039 [Tenebrio molitor]